MEDLSLHILDIVENATAADASLIFIGVEEDLGKDLLRITVKDNGRGMGPDMLEKVRDPFITTRTTRKVGLGLSLLEQSARECGGELVIHSKPGEGTEVTATFQRSHIDRKPMGDMGATLVALIAGNPHVDFLYTSDLEGEEVELDTRVIRAELDGLMSMNDPAVLKMIQELFKKEQ
ncbi:MAG TPA: sensor histidine kinase [Deltaproteobacteria bacterium]|nr:sensor histidine kinase [Deltaproteobacteria bacterium]HIJ41167.1 sensor histidine kinase [Deltaproteobacteria bacterium]